MAQENKKSILKPFPAFVLMLLMLITALVYGAHKGWISERKVVDNAMTGVESTADLCFETGSNLLVVARRHLPEDNAFLLAVEADVQTMAGEKNQGFGEACRLFVKDAKGLLQELSGLNTVLEDADRDAMYVASLLPSAVSLCEERQASLDDYNQVANQYNQGLHSTFSGWLARLTGISNAVVL